MTDTAQDVTPFTDTATLTDTGTSGRWHVSPLGGKVLIVSADNTTFDWAEKWLRRSGLEPIFAGTSQEAIGVCLEQSPDVVVVDASVPGPDDQPLFAMLNSCASGLTVVNIDNGFGAAFAAATINDGKKTAD